MLSFASQLEEALVVERAAVDRGYRLNMAKTPLADARDYATKTLAATSTR